MWGVGKQQMGGLFCSSLLLNALMSVCTGFEFLKIVEKIVFLNIFVFFNSPLIVFLPL